MAVPRVFISSTCYDFSLLRGQLRTSVMGLGYEPVMSDYADVLYDPRTHTHTSCLKEVPTCDAVVLIIGSRFGGKGVPEAISQIDFDALSKASFDLTVVKKKENLSITQLEILKAVELGVPVYAFVDEKVLHDHHVYETNKGSGIVDKITFPSIDKHETAGFIFEFINFLRLRVVGNSVFGFSKYDDIEITLKRQWASLFQRLLQEQRQRIVEERRIDHMAEQFESLKSAILASMPNNDARKIARSVVRFRRVVDFVRSFKNATPTLLESDSDFAEVLHKLGIVDVVDDPRRSIASVLFVCSDGTFYETKYGGMRSRTVELYAQEWDLFRILDLDTKRVVIDTSVEFGNDNLVRYVDQKISDISQGLKFGEEEVVGLSDVISKYIPEAEKAVSAGAEGKVSI